MSAREGSSGAGVRPAGQRSNGGRAPCPKPPETSAGARALRRNAARAWRAAARLADRTGWTALRDVHEVTRRALAAERLRTGRLLARIRLAGITLAFAASWVLPKCFAEGAQSQASLPTFGIYWLVAASLCLAGLRSERMVRLVGLDVALLDMPAAFALQLSARGRPGDPGAALLAITYFTVLILGSCFSLQPRRIQVKSSAGSVTLIMVLLLVMVVLGIVFLASLIDTIAAVFD